MVQLPPQGLVEQASAWRRSSKTNRLKIEGTTKKHVKYWAFSTHQSDHFEMWNNVTMKFESYDVS